MSPENLKSIVPGMLFHREKSSPLTPYFMGNAVLESCVRWHYQRKGSPVPRDNEFTFRRLQNHDGKYIVASTQIPKAGGTWRNIDFAFLEDGRISQTVAPFKPFEVSEEFAEQSGKLFMEDLLVAKGKSMEQFNFLIKAAFSGTVEAHVACTEYSTDQVWWDWYNSPIHLYKVAFMQPEDRNRGFYYEGLMIEQTPGTYLHQVLRIKFVNI